MGFVQCTGVWTLTRTMHLAVLPVRKLGLRLEVCPRERWRQGIRSLARQSSSRTRTLEGIGRSSFDGSCKRSCDEREVRRLVLRSRAVSFAGAAQTGSG